MDKIVLGESGSLHFDTNGINFGDFATYRFECTPNGKLTLTVSQNENSQTYSAVIEKWSVPEPNITHVFPYINNSNYLFDGTLKSLRIWTSWGSYNCDKNDSHNTGNTIIRTDSNCFLEGVGYKECLSCGKIEQVVIPTKDHTDNNLDGVCDNCGNPTDIDVPVRITFIERIQRVFSNLINSIISLFKKIFG